MEIKFKNGKTYELEGAGRDGILVFKDAIFKAPFDEGGFTNIWQKCSLKKRLESWWNKNAPDELKEKYDVSMLSIEEVFDQEEIDRFFDVSGKKPPKSNQLPLFAKDWKARIKRLPDDKTSYYWWLRSRSPDPWWSGRDVAGVGTGGSLYPHNASCGYGCVPVCYPKWYLSSSFACTIKMKTVQGHAYDLPERSTFDECEFSDELAKVHSLLSGKSDKVEIMGTDEGHMWFRTKTFMYEVCIPHEGNDYSWLFRKAPIKGFDRWANSTAEESFFKEFERLVKRIERI